MHIKIITPDSLGYGEPVITLVKRSSRGVIGNDRADLVKRASSEVLAELDQLMEKVGQDETLIHLLAVGATEDYGCFAAGTLMAMGDGDYIPIDSVTVGDFVLSADGSVCEVAHLFCRTVPQSLRFTVSELAETLHCSLNHPFRVARYEQFECGHVYHDIVTEWATADTLREKDFLVCTLPQVTPLWPMGVAEGYLLGAWLAEGCFHWNASNRAVASLRFDVHRDEVMFQSQIQNSAASLGWVSHENAALITVTGDPEHFRLWHNTFREQAIGRVIPPWVCCLPQSVRLSIIAGYLDGDGSCVVDDKESCMTARFRGQSSSLGFQRLCWAAGLPASRCTVLDGKGGAAWNVSIANSQLATLQAFSWKVRGSELLQPSKSHGFCHAGRAYLPIRNIETADDTEVFNLEVAGDHTYSGPNVDSHNCNRNGDGFTRAACRKYHPTFVKHAHFFRNHKNKDSKKAYGRIIKSAFHDPMKRIELLASLYGTESAARRHGGLVADREMEKLAAGREIPVSMACRVSYDKCSYCGNEAARIGDYCVGTDQGGMCKAGGLRDNIGALVEIDGGIHQLHADNPHPVFFDISNVFRPADRIAYVTGALEKAAAARGGVVKSAELAQQLGITVPYELLIDGTQPANVQKMIKLAYQLSDIETAIAQGASPLADVNSLAFHSTVQGCDTPFALPPLFREKFALALRALSDQRICLPLSRFIEVTTDHGHEKAAELASVVAKELPGVYTRLLEGGGLVDQLQASRYEPAQAAAPPRFTNWAAKQASDLSFAKGSVYNRVTRAALRQEESILREPVSHEKISSDRDPTECLADEYALYKLAFLGSVPDSDFENIASLAILQNYVG